MSLLSCFTDGDGDGCDVDVEKYLQRRKRLMCHFNDPSEEDACRVVRDLSLTFFRGRLVEHFDILFHTPNLGVVWPLSRGKEPRVL